MRVAAIDQGTNTTRLLIADVVDGRVNALARRSIITRLGEGVDSRHRLLPLPIARVRNALSEYRRELESLSAERALLVATSAVRDAENGEAFLGEIEWSYGFTTCLLTGDEEAAMTLRGVGGLADGTILVDIGGGSTEFSYGLTECEYARSVDIGCVRLTEKYISHDPPRPEELLACLSLVETYVDDIAREFPELSDAPCFVGLAGTVTSTAAGEPDYDLVRVPLDGRTASSPLLSTPHNESDPALSRDGALLAYVSDRAGHDEIWRRSVDAGGTDQPLVSQRDFGDDRTVMLSSPVFSPDGQRVAYQRNGFKPRWPLRIWISLVAGGTSLRVG